MKVHITWMYGVFMATLVLFFIGAGVLAYRAFQDWEKSEQLARVTRDSQELGDELYLLVVEGGSSNLRLQHQWDLARERFDRNIQYLESFVQLQDVESVKKLLIWTDEIFTLILASPQGVIQDVYREALFTLARDINTMFRVIHQDYSIRFRQEAMIRVIRVVGSIGAVSVILGVLVGLSMYLFILRPVHVFESAIRDFGMGNHGLRSPLFNVAEIDALAMKFNHAADNLESSQNSLIKENAQKEVLLREIHHRMKNNLASIVSMLNLNAGNCENPLAQQALDEAAMRVQGMADLYETMLLRNVYNDLDSSEYLESIITTVLDYFSGSTEIALHTHCTAGLLAPAQLFPLGIIVNEVVTNVVKYAFPHRSEGKLDVSFQKKGSRYCLSISDDGVGLPENFSIHSSKGFGLMLITVLSEQLKADISLSSGADGTGSHFQLFFSGRHAS